MDFPDSNTFSVNINITKIKNYHSKNKKGGNKQKQWKMEIPEINGEAEAKVMKRKENIMEENPALKPIFSFNSLASNMKMTLIWRKRKREITLQELYGKNQRENECVFFKKKKT